MGSLQLQNHYLDMNVNKGPFGGHRLGGDSCPLITFEVVPYQHSWPYKGAIPLCGGSGLGLVQKKHLTGFELLP